MRTILSRRRFLLDARVVGDVDEGGSIAAGTSVRPCFPWCDLTRSLVEDVAYAIQYAVIYQYASSPSYPVFRPTNPHTSTIGS